MLLILKIRFLIETIPLHDNPTLCLRVERALEVKAGMDYGMDFALNLTDSDATNLLVCQFSSRWR